MKVWILYICTGIYDIFWKDFYEACEKYLLKGHEVSYFVFTDAKKIYGEDSNPRIHRIFQANLGWPDSTLMRFHVFLKHSSKYSEMDFLYFMNANLLPVQPIAEEILPSEEGLVVCKHPWYFNKKSSKFTYERNPRSTAYISRNTKGECYVAGWLNWGTRDRFMQMCESLALNIDKDKQQGITAIWHDESHLNKYILSSWYKALGSEYLYPEGAKLNFSPKILIRDKSKFPGFGEFYYRQWRKVDPLSALCYRLKKLLSGISKAVSGIRPKSPNK